jgi:hypothetical protein
LQELSITSMEMPMKRALLVLALAVAAAAEAKLPPPTPEQIVAEQERRAREEGQLQREKALLEQAQDRVAERYRRENGATAAGGTSEGVRDTNMPKTARELPGQGTPEGGRRPSAEAHSAPAK